MISIQSAMLVALGFLVAALLTLIIMPAYRRRVARLTAEAIKRAMPLSEAEIRADKDRLRAEYAISVYRLERKVADSTLAAARQMVEINRRDAAISSLEEQVTDLKTSLEEHQNARRVLEQTITDRLPRVEHRLGEAKKMLLQRDREIAELTQTSDKQTRALEEATQINTQQRDEIQRLGAALTTRAARNRESVADARFDGEVALRAEIEALRAKTRDQASLITRLQAVLARPGSAAAAGSPADAAKVAELSDAEGARAGAEIAKLRRQLSEAEVALDALRASKAQADTSALDAEIKALRAEKRDQAAKVASLEAAVAAFEKAGEADKGKDSRIALKARVSALQAQIDEQTTTIQGLRAEIASSNERMARQAAHFRDEMRRLGAGTVQTSGEVSRRPEKPSRRSLTSRIAEPRVTRLSSVTGTGVAPTTESTSASKVTSGAAESLEAKSAAAASAIEPAVPAATEEKARAAVRLKAVEGGAAKPANGASAEHSVGDVERTAEKPAPATPEAKPAAAKRPRLMDRIIGLDKSSSA